MPKRHFFQIHLSTAVVLMLLAGVLVWANVRAQTVTELVDHKFDFFLSNVKNTYGWPFGCISEYIMFHDDFPERWSNHKYWRKKELALDLLIALAILLSVCVACEWRIQRRKRQQAQPAVTS